MIDASADFNQPLGPMTTAIKQAVWAGQSVTDAASDNSGFFSIASGGRSGGHCCRMTYPAGQGQMQNQFYHVNLGQPGLVVNVQWDWLFETNWTMVDSNTFKVGPAIQWGPISGALGGERLMIWGNTQGSNAGHAKYQYKAQNQFTGGDATPNMYGPSIVPGQWETFRLRFRGGPTAPLAEWYQGGILKKSYYLPFSNTNDNDSVYIDFATFHNVGPAADTFSRQDNVRIWIDAPALLTIDALTLQPIQ